MPLEHGATLPDGITAAGTLVHEVREREEDVNIESMDSEGGFAAEQGKSIRKKKTFSISGDKLDTAALPTVGSGTAVSGSPHIDSVESRRLNEDASKFSIDAHEYGAGEGDYA